MSATRRRGALARRVSELVVEHDKLASAAQSHIDLDAVRALRYGVLVRRQGVLHDAGNETAATVAEHVRGPTPPFGPSRQRHESIDSCKQQRRAADADDDSGDGLL
jgi:hypothetical protein